jgi:hypothetical protein
MPWSRVRRRSYEEDDSNARIHGAPSAHPFCHRTSHLALAQVLLMASILIAKPNRCVRPGLRFSENGLCPHGREETMFTRARRGELRPNECSERPPRPVFTSEIGIHGGVVRHLHVLRIVSDPLPRTSAKGDEAKEHHFGER